MEVGCVEVEDNGTCVGEEVEGKNVGTFDGKLVGEAVVGVDEGTFDGTCVGEEDVGK